MGSAADRARPPFRLTGLGRRYGAHVQLSEQLKNAAAEGVDLGVLIQRQIQHVLKCQTVAETPLPPGTPNAEGTKAQQVQYSQQQSFLLTLQQSLKLQMPTSAFAPQ